MSDDDSEISEELEYEESYSADDFEELVGLSLSHSHATPQIKSVATVVDNEEGLYSEDFDTHTDFLEEEFKPKVASLKSPTVFLQHSSNETATSIPPKILPSTSIHTLQAEIALDELSKEVLRLRNEQKHVLKERKSQAKVKKERANARRQEYHKQLTLCQEAKDSLQKENEIIAIQLKDSNNLVSHLQETLQLQEERGRRTDEELESIKQQLTALQAEYESAIKLASEERHQLIEEADRHKLLASVIEKNAVVNEERLARDRSNLPEYHRNRLADELKRLADKERILDERIAIAKLEDEKRASIHESLRQEVIRELDQGRFRLDMESNEMRAGVQKRQEALDKERTALQAQALQDRHTMDIIKTSLVSKENDISMREAALTRKEADLELHLHTLEPSLKSLERERQIAMNTIDEAERKLRVLRDRETRVLDAERGLQRREAEAENHLLEGQELKSGASVTAMRLRRDMEAVDAQRNVLRSERFRLHSCAMEMSKQMDLIRQSLGHILRQQRLSSLVTEHTASRTSPGDMNMVDPVYANILYALNAASSSLTSMAHNLINPKEQSLMIFENAPGCDYKREAPVPEDEEIPNKYHRPNSTGIVSSRPATDQTVEKISQQAFISSRVQANYAEDLVDITVDNTVQEANESARNLRAIAARLGMF